MAQTVSNVRDDQRSPSKVTFYFSILAEVCLLSNCVTHNRKWSNLRMISELLSWERGWAALSDFKWRRCEHDWTYRRDSFDSVRCCWTCSTRAAFGSSRGKCGCFWRRWLDCAASCLLPWSLQVWTVKESDSWIMSHDSISAMELNMNLYDPSSVSNIKKW